MAERPIRVHELPSCDSTQDELRALAAAGAPVFTSVRADVQLAGRGRRGRSWEAQAGTALLVSILLRPERPAHELPVLSLAGGVAAVECARSFGADAGLSWPNDVVCAGRKLAGVLAELGPEGCVLLGIGMNLAAQASDLPPADRLTPTSLLLETGAAPSPTAALGALLDALRPLASAFDAEGPGAIAARARPLDTLAGSAVQLRLASGGLVEGTAAGIADDGSLLVRAPGGGVLTYASGEVVRLT
ncbi:MAG TPA: biotin--[acetyl-CoA-carboxylase] ligase [Gaiellales bacterium]|jgi:BirA family biotin operon repressor/biotin-[acetyl-CoA-carboxylase] ligase|nr:biotin--[acetyl-CoA-carboxylase] ligase [Gaiellales bacterium]